MKTFALALVLTIAFPFASAAECRLNVYGGFCPPAIDAGWTRDRWCTVVNRLRDRFLAEIAKDGEHSEVVASGKKSDYTANQLSYVSCALSVGAKYRVEFTTTNGVTTMRAWR